MKYRGTFYLYTSNDEQHRLKCRSSKDLINWSDVIISQIIDGSDNKISTENLTKGMYIIKLCTDETEISSKFVKK